MRNKILLCELIIVIMALFVFFGYTNARYYSTASMTGDLDYVKTIGEISIYHPEWVGGYTGPDNGDGIFDVKQVPTEYPSIHYMVTNKVADQINEEEVAYYIRIVAEDGSNNIPIEYNVHEYNNPNNVLNLEAGVGYGPFILTVNTENPQQYSIRVNWTSTDSNYVSSVQHLKVQMIKKRSDGTLKVIDDAPLNMEYSGAEISMPKVTFKYYLYNTFPGISIGTSQELNIATGTKIDFTNNSQLSELGITFPTGGIFHDARHNGNWGGETIVTIPGNEEYSIEVYLTSSEVVHVRLAYFNFANNDPISEQDLAIPRGKTIDFTNGSQLSDLGIKFPIGYKFHDIRYLGHWEGTNTVTTSNDTAVVLHFLEVYMEVTGFATVNLSYYNSEISPSNKLDTQELSNVLLGTNIDFTNLSSLSSLGINLPEGYEFNTAYCTKLDSTGAGHNDFTLPFGGAGETYDIDVVLDAIQQGDQTLDIKLSNGTTKTITLDPNGRYNFDAHNCADLFGLTYCEDWSAGRNTTSFTIRVVDENNAHDVNHTAGGVTVTIDINETYGGKSLKNPGTYIFIQDNGW